MNRPESPLPPEPSRQPGYETTDADPLLVGAFTLGLVVMIALVLLLLSRVIRHFETSAARGDKQRSAVTADQTPPEPRLETDPVADLARRREADEAALSSTGWVDRQKGIVRIPIDLAITILAERGIPEPGGPAETTTRKEATP